MAMNIKLSTLPCQTMTVSKIKPMLYFAAVVLNFLKPHKFLLKNKRLENNKVSFEIPIVFCIFLHFVALNRISSDQ